MRYENLFSQKINVVKLVCAKTKIFKIKVDAINEHPAIPTICKIGWYL